jgi:hypothetical protein
MDKTFYSFTKGLDLLNFESNTEDYEQEGGVTYSPLKWLGFGEDFYYLTTKVVPEDVLKAISYDSKTQKQICDGLTPDQALSKKITQLSYMSGKMLKYLLQMEIKRMKQKDDGWFKRLKEGRLRRKVVLTDPKLIIPFNDTPPPLLPRRGSPASITTIPIAQSSAKTQDYGINFVFLSNVLDDIGNFIIYMEEQLLKCDILESVSYRNVLKIAGYYYNERLAQTKDLSNTEKIDILDTVDMLIEPESDKLSTWGKLKNSFKRDPDGKLQWGLILAAVGLVSGYLFLNAGAAIGTGGISLGVGMLVGLCLFGYSKYRQSQDAIPKKEYLRKLRIFLVELIKIEIELNFHFNPNFKSNHENIKKKIIHIQKSKIGRMSEKKTNPDPDDVGIIPKEDTIQYVKDLNLLLKTYTDKTQNCIINSENTYCLIKIQDLCIINLAKAQIKEQSMEKEIFKNMFNQLEVVINNTTDKAFENKMEATMLKVIANPRIATLNKQTVIDTAIADAAAAVSGSSA